MAFGYDQALAGAAGRRCAGRRAAARAGRRRIGCRVSDGRKERGSFDAMSDIKVGMAVELREAPDAVERQAHCLAAPLKELLARLRRKPPQFVVTCARGSSAHAATFGKHLIERHLGLSVAAAAPNIATVYHRQLHMQDQLFLAVSQSGRSDDLIEFATMARAAGALN